MVAVALLDSSHAFLSSCPEWTLNGALLTAPDDRAARLTQTAFVWSEGAWEAQVSIVPIEPSDGAHTLNAVVRVTPDTLRRWKDVAINPFIEACAQVQEHWRSLRGKHPARSR